MKCPCCGEEMRRPMKLPIVDVSNNRILLDGAYANLKPQQAELVAVLVEAFPRTVAYDTLIARLWGVSEPEHPKNALKVIKCNLCRVLRKFGFDIKSVESRGYRLERVGV